MKSKGKLEISVLMSLYKHENHEWFSSALNSLVLGDVIPCQIVIVEDGPVGEQLSDVISAFCYKFPSIVKLVKLPVNQGLGAALNKGLEQCDFDLVARMDTDDLCKPNRLFKQFNFMLENQDVNIVGSYAEDIDKFSNKIGVRKTPVSHDEIYNLMWTCPIIHPSVMFRKTTVIEAGSYSVELKRRQDYDLWFRCAANGAKFANIPEPLISYRITSDTYKRNSLKVAWSQTLIGFRGCRKLSLGVIPHLGVFYPTVKALLPTKLRIVVESLFKKIDPRETKN